MLVQRQVLAMMLAQVLAVIQVLGLIQRLKQVQKPVLALKVTFSKMFVSLRNNAQNLFSRSFYIEFGPTYIINSLG